jgi:hypothetical protein
MAAARFGSSSGKGVNRNINMARGAQKLKASSAASKGRSASSSAASSSSKSAK